MSVAAGLARLTTWSYLMTDLSRAAAETAAGSDGAAAIRGRGRRGGGDAAAVDSVLQHGLSCPIWSDTDFLSWL